MGGLRGEQLAVDLKGQEGRSMPTVQVTDWEDPRLDAYARLTEVQLRSRLEPELGVFIAESAKVIERAFEAGAEPISLLTDEKHLRALEPLVERMEARWGALPVLLAAPGQLERLTGYELTRGALAAFRRPVLPSPEVLLADARRVAVLEGITNHTNVGAIFRSAAALGADAVLVTPDCYDPLYRRAVRVSMGCVFQVPWTRIGREGVFWADEGLDLLRRSGFATAAMALRDDALPLDDARVRDAERLALIFGTEGDGLDERTIAGCDMAVRIPMAHGVDSLNVAAASAVALWETRVR